MHKGPRSAPGEVDGLLGTVGETDAQRVWPDTFERLHPVDGVGGHNLIVAERSEAVADRTDSQ